MCARHVHPAELDLQKVAFLARYRFPRHLALQVERALVELSPEAAWRAARACSLALLRFLAAVGQARWSARRKERPSLPVSADAFDEPLDGDFFVSELAGHGVPLEELLSLSRSPPSGRTSSADPASLPALREQMLRALAPLTPIASYRLLVPSPGGSGRDMQRSGSVTILLGTGLWHSLELPGDLRLPPNTPALLDPRSGRILSLAPLLRWEPDRSPAGGSIFELRDMEGSDGIYLEAGRAAGRRLRLPLSGLPSEADLTRHHSLLDAASRLPAPLADGQLLHHSHRVMGIFERGEETDLHLATRSADGETVVLATGQTRIRIPDHPGLIGLRPVDGGPRGALLEMSYLSGASLAEQLTYRGVLDPFECLALVEPLCDALGTLHQAGMAHLALRPRDLLLDAGGRLRLAPPPSAVTLEKQPGSAPEEGSASRWLPPPELRGKPPAEHVEKAISDPSAGQAADIWLLGALLGELLLGERPGSPAAVPAPPHLPAPLGKLIRRLLEPRPVDRYPSAAAVAAALRGAVSQLSGQRHIALDLEGTLITTSRDPLPRPHLGDFASWCLDTFHRVFMFTAVQETNARVVMARLVRAGVLPPRFSEQVELVRWPRGRGGVLKDLRLLRVPLHRVALLDDMSAWIPEDQRHRWVPITPFSEPRPGDEELLHIRPKILALLASERHEKRPRNEDISLY